MEVFLKTTGKLKELLPEESNKISEIVNRYNYLRKDLIDCYKKLPECNFQADLNETNIMIDDNFKFMGIIDYNISGMEKILNYSLAESFKPLSIEDVESGSISKERIEIRDNELYKNLDIIGNYYNFTIEEKEIYNKLYNLSIPFRWENYTFYADNFMKMINIKQIKY